MTQSPKLLLRLHLKGLPVHFKANKLLKTSQSTYISLLFKLRGEHKKFLTASWLNCPENHFTFNPGKAFSQIKTKSKEI